MRRGLAMRGLPAGLLTALLACSTIWAAPAGARAADATRLEKVAAMVEAGRLDAAESELRQILALEDNPIARDLLGVVLGRQGRHEEAELELRRAIAFAPDLAAPRQHLARLYLIQKREAEAAAELRAAARLGPLERELGLRLAAIEQAAGDDAAAQRQLRAVAERYESVRALLELARLESGRGDHESALGSLRRALGIAPNSEAVLRAHAEVSLAAAAPIAAVWTLEPLARMHPERVEYPYLLGVARLKVGDAAGAAETLERALALEPRRALTLIALGLAYNNQKRFEEAREHLVRSLRLDPENPEAMAALAQAEEGLGELAEAERHARRALARNPAHSLAHLVVGMVRMKQGDYAAARDALLRSVEANPGSVKARYQLSLAYARLGDGESSKNQLALYREALARMEEALIELNTRTGTGSGGMRP